MLNEAIKVHDALKSLPGYEAPPGWDDPGVSKKDKIMMLGNAAEEYLETLPGYKAPPKFDDGDDEIECAKKILKANHAYAKALPSYQRPPGFDDDETANIMLNEAIKVHDALKSLPGYEAPPGWDDPGVSKKDKIMMLG